MRRIALLSAALAAIAIAPASARRQRIESRDYATPRLEDGPLARRRFRSSRSTPRLSEWCRRRAADFVVEFELGLRAGTVRRVYRVGALAAAPGPIMRLLGVTGSRPVCCREFFTSPRGSAQRWGGLKSAYVAGWFVIAVGFSTPGVRRRAAHAPRSPPVPKPFQLSALQPRTAGSSRPGGAFARLAAATACAFECSSRTRGRSR